MTEEQKKEAELWKIIHLLLQYDKIKNYLEKCNKEKEIIDYVNKLNEQSAKAERERIIDEIEKYTKRILTNNERFLFLEKLEELK